MLDAVVVGSGPNGLGAAVTLARAGCSVRVIEGSETIGGGTRTGELTLPGFRHDLCSAVHPMALATPFLPSLPLADHGLEWVHPPVALAHPFDDGSAAALLPSLDETCDNLAGDGEAYRRLMSPLVRGSRHLFRDLVGPFRLPRHPILAARFGLKALRSGRGLAESRFRTERAQGLIAGLAAHAQLPLESRPGAAVTLMLAMAGHAVGWPMPGGGSQAIADALAGVLKQAGGSIETGRWVRSLDDLPKSRVTLLDVGPRQFLGIAGDRLPAGYRRRLEKYRYGMGVFKLDWALSGPIPWRAAECRQAGTVHLGGTLDEIAVSERDAFEGRITAKPFVLMAQPTLFDPSRAPAGQHVAWGYCHVPHGSTEDATTRIESQVERFAPGFRDLIIGRHAMSPAWLERHNPNQVGGEINGGVADLWQLFARPVLRRDPYRTPLPGVFLCSASTPPAGGVHGLCGWFAARSAMRDLK